MLGSKPVARKVYPIEERCINCHMCEVGCIVEHSQTKTLLGAYQVEKLSFNREWSLGIVEPNEALEQGRPHPLNRCLVETHDTLSISTNCRHCDEPECILACKNGALYQDEEGRCRLHEDRCVGCWMCIMGCSYGAINRNPTVKNVPGQENNGIQNHCDLCPEREIPMCVYVCPTKALVFEDRGRAVHEVE